MKVRLGSLPFLLELMPRPSAFVLAVLSLSACTQVEAPLAPRQDVLTSSALATTKGRPWRSRCEGVAMYTDPTTLYITGVCSITHIGRATVVTTESAIPQPDGTFALISVNAYTAANGDILNTTGVGVATLKPDFSGVTFSGIETAVGGTGRFSHASGRATRIGSTRFSDLHGSYRNAGELTYAASDRSR